MSLHDLTVAYAGRDELDPCRWLLARSAERVSPTPINGPVDLGISAAGSHIFAPKEIDLARCGIVNLHLAPLPEYRGRYSATHAILNREEFYGVTLHYVDEGIDTGPIIAEHRFPVKPTATAGDLRTRALIEGARLFALNLPDLLVSAVCGERLPSFPQDESRAHYYDRFSLPAAVPGDALLERALAC